MAETMPNESFVVEMAPLEYPIGHTVGDFSPPPTTRREHMDDDMKVEIITMIRDIGDGDELRGICISRVVHTMRDIEPNLYTPTFVSIGPFHYGDKRLQYMERCKQVLLKRFTQRGGTDLDVLISFIKSSVPKVRASYSKNICLSDMDLVKLILVDANFIIELFFSFHHDAEMEMLTEDSKLSQPAIRGTLPLDLVLFENQLPFFVLKELFAIAFPHDLNDNVPTFAKLACEFFCQAFDLEMPKHDPDNYMNVNHFTDLIRFLLLQRAPPPPITMEPYFWNTGKLLYSAKELQEFGVKFKLSNSKSILDINFSGNVLELPEILVPDLVTDALFRNMIAFEQLHCSFTSYITNYVTLWTSLINTKEDVHVLADKKVIHCFKHDAYEVLKLFRSIGRSGFQAAIIPEYIDIFERLNKFCENPWCQSIASLRRDCCRTRLDTAVTYAYFSGTLILILTLLQAIFSIL